MAKVDKVQRLVERGLDRYGAGDLRGAIAAWEEALALDPGNIEAHRLIETARNKLVAAEAATPAEGVEVALAHEADADRRKTARKMRAVAAAPDDDAHLRETVPMPAPGAEDDPAGRPRRRTTPVMGSGTEPWQGKTPAVGVAAGDRRRETPPESLQETAARLLEAERQGDVSGAGRSRRRRSTPASPLPAMIASMTSPEWQLLDEPQEGAPDASIFADATRRLAADERRPTPGRVPVVSDSPADDPAKGARLEAFARIQRCEALASRGEVAEAAAAAEATIALGETAPPPGIAEVIEPARALFERVFSQHIGPLEHVPQVVVAPGDLAARNLDPRLAFLVSRIDGVCTVEDLLDMAGMPRFEALRALSNLLRDGVVDVG